MSSTPTAGGRGHWPVIVIDDEAEEGRWIVERLRERGHDIDCIADSPDAIRYEPDVLSLRARLVRAKAAIAKRNGDEFRSICQLLPTVVVLDQFLPDPDQGDISPRPSLGICEFVNEIWDKVLREPAFLPLGWNVCVLMYTGQGPRWMERWLDQTRITGRPWFDYATKPEGIPACTPEVASAEGRQLVLQVNALTRGTRPRETRLDVVPDLYAGGRQGNLLREAIRVAASSPTKPVWIVGRWRDGCEKVVPLVVPVNPRLEPKEVVNDGLFDQLDQLWQGLAVHPVFALRGRVSVERLVAFCQRAECKFVIVCDESPGPLLAPFFSAIWLVPLYD